MPNVTWHSPDATVSYTDQFVYTNSFSGPTGRAMFNGSTACLVTHLRAWVSGRSSSRTVTITFGSSSVSLTRASSSSAQDTGYVNSSDWLVSGGSHQFRVAANGSFYFGRNTGDGRTTISSYGTSWTGGLSGGYTYVQAPTAPQSLSASTPTGTPTGRISLSWSAPSDDGGTPITGYNIYTSGGTYVGTTTGTTFTVTGLTPGTSYSYVVRALNAVTTAAGTQSVNSNTATAVASGIPTAPGTPTGTSGVDAFGKVVLSWTAPSETYGTVTGYRIYGTTGGVETLVASTTGTGTTNISVTGLTQRANYTFRVAARNAYTDGAGTEGTRSASSASIQASGPPTAPTGLTAVVPDPEVAQRLTLNWAAPSNDGDPSGGITGYRIFYSTGVLIASVNGTSTTYNVDGLIPGQEYGFYVQARNAISDVVGTHSANSNIAYATPVGAPDQVTGLTATPVSAVKGAVLLMWDEDPFADGYLVYRNTTPTLTLLQRIPGAGNNTYVHYLDRTATSYSSQSYVVSAYNEFAPDGGLVSTPASATPNLTVLQSTPSTATSNLTNQNVYSGDFSIVSLTADTFTYTRTAPNLSETSVPATFGTVTNITNDDISGQFTITADGPDTFSYTAPTAGLGDIPSETVAASSTAENNTNELFNGQFTVLREEGTDGIVYSVTGTNPTIAEVAATGTIVNQSNTTFNVTAPITDVTSSTVSFAAPGAADEPTTAAEGVVTDITNRDVFNDDDTVVLSAPAHNVLVYELPGAPESSGTQPYTYSSSTTAGDPGTSAVTATNLATNPSFETGSGTVEVRRNLAVNPCIGGSITNLTGNRVTLSDGGTFVRATITDPLSGGGNQTISATQNQTATAVVAAGDVVTIQAEGRASSEPQLLVALQFLDAANASLGTTTGTLTAVNSSTFTPLASVTATAPANATRARWFVWPGNNPSRANGQTFDVRNVIVERSPVAAPFFSGATTAGGDFTYAWTGTANASASVQNAVGVAQLAPATGQVSGVLSGNRTYQSGEWDSSGTKSLRITPVSASTDSFASPGGDSGGIRLGMQANRTYTAIARLRLAAPQTGTLSARARRIVFYNVEGSTVETLSTAAPNTAGEHIVRLTFTVSSGATAAWIRLYNGASAGNGDVWWDDFMLIEGTYTGPYFDGSTAPSEGNTFAWTGTANASTSTMTTSGVGGLRFDSTTVGDIKFMRLDNLDRNAVNRTAWYQTWDDYTGSEPVFGVVSIDQGEGAPLLFSVTGAPVNSTGYYTIPVQHISGALPDSGEFVSVTFIPYVSTEVLSPYGAVRRANSTAKLEIRYRSGWLA